MSTDPELTVVTVQPTAEGSFDSASEVDPALTVVTVQTSAVLDSLSAELTVVTVAEWNSGFLSGLTVVTVQPLTVWTVRTARRGSSCLTMDSRVGMGCLESLSFPKMWGTDYSRTK